MSFRGARVLSFESRRAKEMGELIRLNGGDPFVAPAMIEVPRERDMTVAAFADRLYRSEFDMMIFLTGVGARLLDRLVTTGEDDHRFRDALRKLAVVTRGPKPMAVMREWCIPVAVQVPEPATWREILLALLERPGQMVAIQEYGRPHPELVAGLTAQGRTVSSIAVYRWGFPADTAPLLESIQKLLAGEVDVVLFTSAVQLEHLLQLAGNQGQKEAVIDALSKTYIASIGPISSAYLQEQGLLPAMEPNHPKMGVLVREAASSFAKSRLT